VLQPVLHRAELAALFDTVFTALSKAVTSACALATVLAVLKLSSAVVSPSASTSTLSKETLIASVAAGPTWKFALPLPEAVVMLSVAPAVRAAPRLSAVMPPVLVTFSETPSW
jgi:hypothetical protein